ncbi:CdaR family protein [Fictibacillus gelatini]|uniref:CdaR family protein n=1 Tax=Fictibacillus gelatini TaxID=225985 RepID=UPI0003F891C5|nr:CdaR family protein [Fictibacillus gelatini]
MEKLLNNNWFVKIVAFLIALLMYTMVSFQSHQEENRSPWYKSSAVHEKVTGVEINPYFDQKKYILTDLPRSVDIELSGPSSLMTKVTKINRSFEVYIDLRKLGPGVHKVPVKVRNLPDGLSAKVSPKQVTITLHNKETKSMPINVDLKNLKKLGEGYATGDVEFSPKVVQVTGIKEYVDDISFITGYVDVSSAKDTIEKQVPLRAYNSQGEFLDVNIEPGTVHVKVPIHRPEKTVPVSIDETGELPEGLSLVDITTKPKEVKLAGPSSVLDSIGTLKGLAVDLSKVTKDTTLFMDVPIPDGVKEVSPKKIEIHIDVKENKTDKTKTIHDIPIDMNGLAKGQEATILDPNNATVDITVTGNKQTVDQLKKSDFGAFVNLSGLDAGKHNVTIQLESPGDVTVDPVETKATVNIEEKATESSAEKSSADDTKERD